MKAGLPGSMMNSILFFLPHINWTSLQQDLLRLLLAAVLGGFIGLERELKRRPAGLRTNMFICFGAAMFTILSSELAGAFGSGDHTRIAAQIIPGIGFIGAGSILHARSGSVSGLTTAATIFVVASIGMACGGGFYSLAVFAGILIFIALRALGWMEQQFGLKALVMNYSVMSEKPASDLVVEAHSVVEQQGKELRGLHLSRPEGKQELVFSVDAPRREHKELMEALRRSELLKDFEVKAGLETE
ncbi:MAG TPA: MgtC/SapB family protein [Candidatus Angelobacter sp.]|nr:MgtC/SapB family protein [Candidatus Angelobacter sp.]